MKMSAAQIRSVFKCHNSAHEQLFRFARSARPVAHATAPVSVVAVETQHRVSRQAALDQHYQVVMRRESAKIRLL